MGSLLRVRRVFPVDYELFSISESKRVLEHLLSTIYTIKTESGH